MLQVAARSAAHVAQRATSWGPKPLSPGSGEGGSRAKWTQAQIAVAEAADDAAAAARSAAEAAAAADASAEQAAKETPWSDGYVLIVDPYGV